MWLLPDRTQMGSDDGHGSDSGLGLKSVSPDRTQGVFAPDMGRMNSMVFGVFSPDKTQGLFGTDMGHPYRGRSLRLGADMGLKKSGSMGALLSGSRSGVTKATLRRRGTREVLPRPPTSRRGGHPSLQGWGCRMQQLPATRETPAVHPLSSARSQRH